MGSSGWPAGYPSPGSHVPQASRERAILRGGPTIPPGQDSRGCTRAGGRIWLRPRLHGPTQSWAGAATPTQRNTIQPQESPRKDSDVLHGTPLPRKGNPPWPTGNAVETITPWTPSFDDRPRNLVAAIGAWLADVPLWIGSHLFMSGDEEACWHGWQITRLHGGLGRGYRDTRFGQSARELSRS